MAAQNLINEYALYTCITGQYLQDRVTNVMHSLGSPKSFPLTAKINISAKFPFASTHVYRMWIRKDNQYYIASPSRSAHEVPLDFGCLSHIM